MPSTPPPTALRELLHCLDNNRGDLLQYDVEQQQLVPYPWPLNESLEPVHVDDFVIHHASYRFPYPACFCPVLLGSAQNIQALVRVSPHKSVDQRLVAVCAKDVCGYFVNLVFRSGGLVQYYPLRVSKNLTLPRAFSIPADAPARQALAGLASFHSRPIGPAMSYPVAGLCYIPLFYPPAVANEPSIPTLLYRLNSAHHPGLEEKLFQRLFTRCDCGIVSTTRTFEGHKCRTNINIAVGGMDIDGLDDGEIVRLLLMFDVGSPSLGVEVFFNLFARCVCGMIMTKRRFRIHECLPVF